jgi:hypothetical protein
MKNRYIEILQKFVNQCTCKMLNIKINIKLKLVLKLILIFNILHVHFFANFCRISKYLFFITHGLEDGHMSGRNMSEVLLRF